MDVVRKRESTGGATGTRAALREPTDFTDALRAHTTAEESERETPIGEGKEVEHTKGGREGEEGTGGGGRRRA